MQILAASIEIETPGFCLMQSRAFLQSVRGVKAAGCFSHILYIKEILTKFLRERVYPRRETW